MDFQQDIGSSTSKVLSFVADTGYFTARAKNKATMFISKEIRWFTETKDLQIIHWFAGQGLAFGHTASRTDFYLPLGQDDLTVKLREGNIEIKQRTGQPKRGNLMPTAEGYFEDWVKWSFNADNADRLSREITQAQKYDWTETIKTRIGVKIAPDGDDNTKIVSINDRIPYGCQIEYTQLIVNRKTFYTFALEWFGERHLELDNFILAEILGDTVFKIEDSMGYGGFLNSRYNTV